MTCGAPGGFCHCGGGADTASAPDAAVASRNHASSCADWRLCGSVLGANS